MKELVNNWLSQVFKVVKKVENETNLIKLNTRILTKNTINSEEI